MLSRDSEEYILDCDASRMKHPYQSLLYR